MKHIIFSTLVNSETIRVITETGASGGKWGRPVNLSAIDVPTESLRDFVAADSWLRKTDKWNVLERWEVDAANQGPRSKYGRTLAAMKKEALAAGVAIGDEQDLQDVGILVLAERVALRQSAGLTTTDETAIQHRRAM